MRSCRAARLSGVPSRALSTSYVSASAIWFASAALALLALREAAPREAGDIAAGELAPLPVLLPPHSVLL